MSSQGSGRFSAYFALLLLILAGGVYVWKEVELRSAVRKTEEQRAAVMEEARRVLVAQTADMLNLVALPVSWAVGAEAQAGNYENVNAYFRRLVKEKFVTRVVLVDPEGTIKASTDMKLLGESAYALLDPSVLEGRDVRAVDSGEGDLLVVAPVVKGDALVGTVILFYSRDAVEGRLDRAVENDEAVAP